ncbi:Rpn family recombination-promoting nuclease/putative transposase, partial [Clostridium sp. DL1XJH146]
SKIKSGSKYSSLTKTITINILNFNYLEFENYHTINSICEDKSKKRLTDILQIHFIELPKFIKVNKNLQDPLERWLTFLVNPEDEALEEIEMVEDKIKKAHETLEYLSQDEETVILARLREKAIMDEASRLEGAREEGIKEGIKEG